MTSADLVIACTLAAATFTYRFLGPGIDFGDVISVAVPVIWVICFGGIYLTIKAYRHLRRDELGQWEADVPRIEGAPKRPRPPSWPLAKPAVCICISLAGICFVVGLLASRSPRVPSEPRRLVIVFKSSPVFTQARRKRLTEDLEAAYKYLSDIGFDVPTHVPPIEVVPQSKARGSTIISGAVSQQEALYLSNLVIGEYRIDEDNALTGTWMLYVFEQLLAPKMNGQSWLLRSKTENLFASYYSHSFSDSQPGTSSPWLAALWELRSIYGQGFVDQSLFYSFSLIEQDDDRETNFNTFFKYQFMRGIGVADNRDDKYNGITSFLESRGFR